jgi:hypothetical protein
MKAFLDTVDWNRPWFSAVAPYGRALASATGVHAVLNAASTRFNLRNASGRPIRFAHADAAGAAPYEAHIARTGEVPTRNNTHDLFNALVWLALGRTKARLNALQAAAIEAAGIGGRRGALRDAATLIDESGVLLVTRRAELFDALAGHDWRALFVDHRAAWNSEIRVIVVGHAVLEKLLTPYKSICAHALPVALDAASDLADIDAFVAAQLDGSLAPHCLHPVPLLGIPGWAANDNAVFYCDPQVFRPARDRGRASSAIASSP